MPHLGGNQAAEIWIGADMAIGPAIMLMKAPEEADDDCDGMMVVTCMTEGCEGFTDAGDEEREAAETGSQEHADRCRHLDWGSQGHCSCLFNHRVSETVGQ